MNVVDADKGNNSHLDIPNRIYLILFNYVLQQTQIHPYYGCRYGWKFDLEYNLSFSANYSEDIFGKIDTHSICPNIASLAGVVVVRWVLCMYIERGKIIWDFVKFAFIVEFHCIQE